MATAVTGEHREHTVEDVYGARPVAESIHVLMGTILRELPPIGKNQVNTEQRFNFRGIDAILDQLNALMGRYGVFAMPEVLERLADKRTTGRGSTMYEVNLHVRFTFYGPRGDFVTCSAWGEGTDMGDKSTNKAHTGAFKNALVAAFAISTGEPDPDSHAPVETFTQPPRPAPQDLGWPSPDAAKEAHAAITRRINALPKDVADRFKAWMRDNAIPWPARPEQLAVAESELADQEAYVEAEASMETG
jgi:hypothetical protein